MLGRWLDQRKTRRALHKLNSSIKIEGDVKVIGPISHLTLGDEVHFADGLYLHLGGMDWCEYQGYLHIGDHSHIGPQVVIYGTGPFGIHIGTHFDCGPGVRIFSSKTNMKTFDKRDFDKVTIGNYVTLYANVVVSPGVKIGDHAVIAANSTVTTNIPAHAFYGGNPARLIRSEVRP